MRKLLSIAALVAGIWLIYRGIERQDSLVGKTASSISNLRHEIDGGPHPTLHAKYLAAGAVLVAGGAIGLGLIKR